MKNYLKKQNYGIKIIDPIKKQEIFNSKYPFLGVDSTNTNSFKTIHINLTNIFNSEPTSTGEQIYTLATIPHNLGYKPMFNCFWDVKGSDFTYTEYLRPTFVRQHSAPYISAYSQRLGGYPYMGWYSPLSDGNANGWETAQNSTMMPNLTNTGLPSRPDSYTGSMSKTYSGTDDEAIYPIYGKSIKIARDNSNSIIPVESVSSTLPINYNGYTTIEPLEVKPSLSFYAESDENNIYIKAKSKLKSTDISLCNGDCDCTSTGNYIKDGALLGESLDGTDTKSTLYNGEIPSIFAYDRRAVFGIHTYLFNDGYSNLYSMMAYAYDLASMVSWWKVIGSFDVSVFVYPYPEQEK